MPRQARVVVPGVPHHVLQRGNRRQQTFFRDADYQAYLRFAADAFAEARVEIWAYCLMPNHVHLIATPGATEALAHAVGVTHARYTRRINRREGWSGYLWQGRFTSFPMDENYLRRCARYVGLNPVRAGLAGRAVDWRWSSVGAHVEGRPDPLLTPGPLAERLGPDMARFFDIDSSEEERLALRLAASTGRPLGAPDWVKTLEVATGRDLKMRPVGRPKNGDTHLFPLHREA
jgi:putative transposase